MDTVCNKKWVSDSILCQSQTDQSSTSFSEESSFSSREDRLLQEEVDFKLEKRAIELHSSCHPWGGYYSRIFLVQKKPEDAGPLLTSPDWIGTFLLPIS